MASLDLAFRVLAKDEASKTFDKVGDSVDKTGSKMGKLGKVAGALAAGGVLALGAGLVSAFKGGIAEFKDNESALAQLEQGLKSTGGVANVTGKEIQGLADAIEAKTGTDGAQIVSGAALLATFTKVRNEVGKGNDVFARATQAGVDLAARGFGSVESNAILLGKALNDPIKGLAALGKQGVTFTAEQKKTIASLVATGDVLGAQKIILKEVEGQVGGSADAFGKTLPGQLARANAALDGAKETFVKALLPAITSVLEFVTTRLIPGLQDLAQKFGPGLADTLRNKVVPAVMAAGVVLVAVAGFVQRNFDVIGPVVAILGSAAAAFVVVTTAAKAYAAVQAALNVVLTANPIGLVIVAVAALVAGITIAYQRSETFRTIVNGALNGVKEAFIGLASTAIGALEKLIGGLGAVARALGTLPGALGAPFRAAADAIEGARVRVGALQAGINSLRGKEVNVRVVTTEVQRFIVEGQRAAGRGSIPGFADGGILPPGLAVVGERGPEVIVSRGGDRVFSNQDSKRLLDGAANGSITYNVSFAESDPVRIITLLRRMEALGA